jgi:hypothetical protein
MWTPNARRGVPAAPATDVSADAAPAIFSKYLAFAEK